LFDATMIVMGGIIGSGILPHQGVWAKWAALRVGARGTGFGAAHVATERFVRSKSGASRRAAQRSGVANLRVIRDRPCALLKKNREILNQFLAERADLAARPLEFGTTAFPRLLSGSVEQFSELFRNKYEGTPWFREASLTCRITSGSESGVKPKRSSKAWSGCARRSMNFAVALSGGIERTPAFFDCRLIHSGESFLVTAASFTASMRGRRSRLGCRACSVV